MDWAPNRTRLLRLSNARTTPTAAPAKATSGNDLEPISSSCRISSRPSKGRLAADRTTCQAKRPRSPNHSRKPLVRLQTEVRPDWVSDPACGASGLIERREILASWLTICPQRFYEILILASNFHFEIKDACRNRSEKDQYP